jgi:CBS domain-containing protein
MQRTVLTVSGDTELQYIINLMRYESVGSLPVLGQALSSLSHGLPSTAAIVGIITKTNLLSLEIS